MEIDFCNGRKMVVVCVVVLYLYGCVYHDSCCNIQPWAWAVHLYCSAYVDSAFHPLWDGKMSIS